MSVPGFAALRRDNLGTEALAGVTLAAIAIPLNIGYAQIAGLPPTAGLYALLAPALVYAFVVSSRQVVVSPDAAAVALVASSLGGLAAAGSEAYLMLAMAQAMICGVLLLAMSAFRLGFLASFLSEPILLGFVGGLALDILLSQVAKMLGVELPSGEEFVGKLVALVEGLPETNPWSVLISVASLGALVAGRRWLPTVPWALAVLVVATVGVAATEAERAGVSILGEVPSGPPSLVWPELGLGEWLSLIPSALALTTVIMVEGLLVSRSYAEHRNYPMTPDRDLAAYGLANLASGISGSFAVGSSTSRTAAMDQAGSRTQLPSLVVVAITLLLLVFGTGLLASIPSPAIGAIVAMAVAPLVGIARFRAVWRLDRFECGIAAACFAVTLLVGSIAGIGVAFILALINIVRRAAHPRIDVLAVPDAGSPGGGPDETRLVATDRAESAPGVVVIRVAAPLFFANADVFARAVKTAIDGAVPQVRHLVVDMEAVTDIDVTAADGFVRLREWLARRGVEVSFSRLRVEDRPRLERLSVVQPEDRVFPTSRAALDTLRDP